MNLFSSEVFRNALLAGTIVALIAAPVGYFLVLRAHAFAGEALKDIGFAGATGAALFGLPSVTGLIGLTLAAAIALASLSERFRGRDIEVGMVLSFALGLGVLFLSMWAHSSASHAGSGVTILFGSILSISRLDIAFSIGAGLLVLAGLAVAYRPLLFVSVDPTVAEARGLPVRGLSTIFMLILALTVSASVLVVGVLLVGALLIAPAAAAINITRKPAHALLVAIIISVGATWAGIALAFLPGSVNLPVAFTISALTSLSYFASLVAHRVLRPMPAAEVQHGDREVRPGVG